MLGLAACGAALHIVAAIRLRKHLREPDEAEPADTPPLTLWRALKPGVPDLDAKLDALALASRAGDQILLGADADSAPLAACETFRERHRDRQIDIVACGPDRAANPKISKFIQMTPFARHAHWLITDSEAIPEARFIDGLRREWMSGGANVLTCGYRLGGLRTLPQILDAAPALLTLWPGLMLAGRINFTLGACTGVMAADIRSIGGWETIGQDLAEDHRLGVLLAAAGRTIHLSRHVLTLDSDPYGWRDLFRHQHRVAVTYRAAAPAGALGLPILHTLGPAAIAAALHPAWWNWVLVILGVRLVAAAMMSRALRFPLPFLPLTAIASAVLETVMWLAAWFSRSVWWSGRWRAVRWRGVLRKAP
jgi:ceramide glucosyltransferase